MGSRIRKSRTVSLESKIEPEWKKTTLGGTPHRKNVYWEGEHHTYFVDEGNTWGGDTAQHRKIGGGTPHILC